MLVVVLLHVQCLCAYAASLALQCVKYCLLFFCCMREMKFPIFMGFDEGCKVMIMLLIAKEEI